MEFGLALLVVSLLFTVPLAVLTLVDLVSTKRWVRTVGWRNTQTAMREGEPALVAALYAIYVKQLTASQRTMIETYLHQTATDRAAQRLSRARQRNPVTQRAGWDESAVTYAPPFEPGGNPSPE